MDGVNGLDLTTRSLLLRSIIAGLSDDAAPRERVSRQGGSSLRLEHEIIPAAGTQALEAVPGVPSDLGIWWSLVERAELFRDADFGQWGLRLYSLAQALEATRAVRDELPYILETDLVIGEFFGDQDFVIVRCDRASTDWGSVLIRVAMEVRPDWPTVAGGFIEFIAYWAATNGDKYWDVSGVPDQ